MKIVPNTGADRVVDIIRPWLQTGNRVDLASQALSLFAFGELAGNLARLASARLSCLPTIPRSICWDLMPTEPSAIACRAAGWPAVVRPG